MKLTHASLFSGIGGAELAASWLGWTNVFHCEIQEFQRQVLEYWFPNSISYEDITKTDFSKWRRHIDVLTGGFPCQPFSVAGKRKGAEDNRYLWNEMLRAIRQIQPTWVVGENVNGILSMVQPSKATKMGRASHLFEESHIYRTEQQFIIETICSDFERAGYSVQPIVIPACSVGAPHRRDRVWIIAHRTDTGSEDLQQGRENGVSQSFSSANASSRRCSRGSVQTTCERKEEKKEWRGFFGFAKRPGSKQCFVKPDFSDFPTVSPVCSRSDGLPFRVADLTISFAKWRRKSIEALGNAWVPQVAFEIFKAIEENYKNNKAYEEDNV